MEALKEIFFFREILLPVIDVLVVSYIIYRLYLMITETRAVAVLKGVLLILALYLVSKALGLETLDWLIERFASVAAIALIILFQPELRRVLMKMGQGGFLSRYMDVQQDSRKDIVEAVEFMSGRKLGALIAFERSVGLRTYIETGTPLDSEISFELLISLFSKESPLHDGAVIIQHTRISAAGCFLPLTMRRDIRKEYGTRHRAAIGLSEETDAAVLVVSEETGNISLAIDGKIRAEISHEKLGETLLKALGQEKAVRRKRK